MVDEIDLNATEGAVIVRPTKDGRCRVTVQHWKPLASIDETIADLPDAMSFATRLALTHRLRLLMLPMPDRVIFHAAR